MSVFATTASAETYQTLFPNRVADGENPAITEIFNAMDFKTGKITLPGGIATVDTGDKYYFLDQKDLAIVLEALWGNPPGSSVLGMVFPIDKTPLDDFWGMTLSYDDIGYVEDNDAKSYDYDDLLKTLQKDTSDANKWRAENGYGIVTLVGWAEPPHYDEVERKLYWAKNLKFSDDDTSTLNYDIRALGRQGVLVMSVIASMNELDQVRAAAPDLLAMTEFTEGNRYSDFKPGVDKVAAVGIGGLIAGKVLAKTGLLVMLMAFLKKGFILLLLPLFWLKSAIFGRGKES